MAKFSKPILFSDYFNVDQDKFDSSGLVEPFVNVDTRLFIDPTLLAKSQCEIIAREAYRAFRSHFNDFVRMMALSRRENDAAWKAAARILDLSEPPETGLGFGTSRRTGSSRSADVQSAIMRTTKEIIDLGSSDPEMISLMGFFEKDVGPDTISDFTTRAIRGALEEITRGFCVENGIELENDDEGEWSHLPAYDDPVKGKLPIILVPRDIVRDLPIANDWSDIWKVCEINARLRDRVNRLLGGIAESTAEERKKALRAVALSEKSAFEDFLGSVQEVSEPYDPKDDALSYYKMKSVLGEQRSSYVARMNTAVRGDEDLVYSIAMQTLEHFKHHVENGNLWEELWDGSRPKKERSAQLIYFAIAEILCEANNVDISPEVNMGGGPVDFKLSKGSASRVVVELKKSGGSVVHGYTNQLEFYKKASKTKNGIFVVIDFGDGDAKIREIRGIKSEREELGEAASQIVVIDANKKASASKRLT